MSKVQAVNTTEMETVLGGLKAGAVLQGAESYVLSVIDAIRALIVEAPAKQAQIDEQIKLIDEYVILQGKIKEWQERAKQICKYLEGTSPDPFAILMLEGKLITDIRDFGKEKS